MDGPGEDSRRGAAPLGAVGIEEAARQVGVSPSALREWERRDLVRPARTAGGARRYSAGDVARLRRIRAWRTAEGLNAAAIRRLLGASGATPASPGPRLRSLRRASGLSLREVAARSGLSASFISSLERGLTGASLAALRRLVEAYGHTVGELVPAEAPGDGRLVRPAERRVLDAGRGIRIEHLSAVPTALETHLFVLAPGATSDGAYRHAGEEFMYVLAGSLGVWLDEPAGAYRLGPGDALTFPSTVGHRIEALGQTETRVLWVNTPPTI